MSSAISNVRSIMGTAKSPAPNMGPDCAAGLLAHEVIAAVKIHLSKVLFGLRNGQPGL